MTNRIAKTNTILTIGLIAVFLLQYAPSFFYATKDHTYWVDYASVEAKDEINGVGEPLVFISTSALLRRSDIKWVDTLRCESVSNGTFSQYVSEAKGSQRDTTDYQSKEWVYHGNTPKSDDTCYLDTKITVTDPSGREHTQEIISGKFKFE